MTWTIDVFDARSGRIMRRTGGFISGIPAWYDSLPDRFYCRL